MKTLVGIGNPLIDLFIDADPADLERLAAQPGSMNLVDRDRQDRVLAVGPVRRALAGGSCANTLRGVSWLVAGSEPRPRIIYCGAVGTDDRGETFRASLRGAGVHAATVDVATPTGSSAILVTPDHERTMFTYLGACRELTRAHLADTVPAQLDVLHLTGYMWDTTNQREAATWAIERARACGATVSFDLADPFVVDRYRDELIDGPLRDVDVLFGNAIELGRMVGSSDAPPVVAAAALKLCPVVILKDGARGSWIARRDDADVRQIAPFPVTARDTTGAGDAFAAGYLGATLLGHGPVAAVSVANRVAATIVSVYGCSYRGLDAPALIREALSRGAG